MNIASILQSILLQLTLSLSIFGLFIPTNLFAEETSKTPVSEVRVLGLNLIESDPKSVRKHLQALGGFLQAKSTIKQTNIDKFFPWSNQRDSYHIIFRYNASGKITSVKRLYRPYSLEVANKRSAIATKDIAQSLIQQLGQPNTVIRKGWGGTQKYHAYTWKDDKVTIRVDREGSERLGNVFIEYIVNIHDPYEVEIEKGDA